MFHAKDSFSILGVNRALVVGPFWVGLVGITFSGLVPLLRSTKSTKCRMAWTLSA